MIEREHIEQLLRLNGIETSAPDSEIKSVLISARWQEDDVEAALLVLRENPENHETHVDSLHKVFRSDEDLSPEMISTLLGIDVPVENVKLSKHALNPQTMESARIMMQIGLASLCVSLVFVLASMWYLEIGIFHVTMR